MKIGKRPVKIFKMDNRSGYAAICGNCLTEGKSRQEAYARMEKAVSRVERRTKKK